MTPNDSKAARDMRFRFMETLNRHHVRDLHALFQGEWWTRGRSFADVERMLTYSTYVFGLCRARDDRLVAFARVLTDRVFKALIFDVIVAPAHRGEGLGRRLMERIVRHAVLKKVRHLELYCLPELVPFYGKWQFSSDVSGVVRLRRTLGTAPASGPHPMNPRMTSARANASSTTQSLRRCSRTTCW